MTSKYSHLPDIDLSSKDVYEYEGDSSKLETCNPSYHVEHGSKDIDTSKLKHSEAVQVFESSQVDASESDFSGRIDDRLPHAYKTHTQECIEARLARLKREVEEVELELERTGQRDLQGEEDKEDREDGEKRERQKPSLGDSAKELRDILRKLSSNHDNNKSQRGKLQFYNDLGEKSKAPDMDRLLATVDDNKSTEKLGDLEERLHTLESKLGIVGSEQDKPIVPVLMYLKERISLLTASPATLDRAINNLKSLSSQTDKLRNQVTVQLVSGDTTKLGTSGDENSPTRPIAYNHAHQINTIYKNIPILKTVSDQIPLILQRLETLQTIHADATEVTNTVRDFDATLTSLQTGMDQWQENIKTLEKKIEDYQARSDANVSMVQEWVKGLEARI